MTLFSSRPPFNDDPEWFCIKCGENSWIHGQPDSECVWEPVDLKRPEYDRPQHNPTNLILSNYRECRAESAPFTTPGNWAYNLLHPSHESWYYATPEQVKHAYKVLSRLERMSR